jgi:hypothetical protein
MKLADWLIERKMTRTAFAVAIGKSPSLVTLLCGGKVFPSHTVAKAIEEQTDGAVTANDFVRRSEEEESRPVRAGSIG